MKQQIAANLNMKFPREWMKRKDCRLTANK
jgi:hypothetical protein